MPPEIMLVACATCVVLGMVGLYLFTNLVAAVRKKNRKRTRPAKPAIINRLVATLENVGTMNIVLMVIGAVLIWFTVTMIDLFREYGSVPDTLVNCVFLALTGECGVLGWIKTSKVKHREREWMKENANTVPPAEDPSAEDGPSTGAG